MRVGFDTEDPATGHYVAQMVRHYRGNPETPSIGRKPMSIAVDLRSGGYAQIGVAGPHTYPPPCN